MLDEELDKIINAVKTLDETKSFDYMTPVWNIVKESNIIDVFSSVDLTCYIKKYTVIARTSNLEKLLNSVKSKGKVTDSENQYLNKLKEEVLNMRQYISNGFVAEDDPDKTSEGYDGKQA